MYTISVKITEETPMPAYNPGALVLYHAKSATVTAVNKEKIREDRLYLFPGAAG